MKSSGKAPLFYRVMLLVMSPLVLGYTLWRTFKDGGSIYLQQRFGLALPEITATVWVHAASVGEINTVYPLLAELKKRAPAETFLVTTNTPTGKRVLAAKDSTLQHAYLPLDYTGSIRRFLAGNSFAIGIIVETEIWPTLYGSAEFPLCIINGRLSAKTLDHAGGRLKSSYRYATSQLDLILARSAADARSFMHLGVDQNKIEVMGNLKFAKTEPVPTTQSETRHGLPEFCLLASTHDDEELQLTRAWLVHNVHLPLVVAPRHPERSKSIQSQLKKLTKELDRELEVRSLGAELSENSSVYLADTLGEMNLWFSNARSIFIGGSLVPKGGHNMLEAAQHGKSVICGQHYQNFKDEVELLQSRDAIQLVNTAEAAVEALIETIKQPDSGTQRDQRAKELVHQQGNIHEHYANRLSIFSPVFNSTQNTRHENSPS